MQDIPRKRTEDELALLLGDGDEHSVLKGRALIFAIERVIAPLAERIEQLEARSARFNKCLAAIALAVAGLSGAAITAVVEEASTHFALQAMEEIADGGIVSCRQLLVEGRFNLDISRHPEYGYLDEDGNGIAFEREVSGDGNWQ